jgi:hypothetical protein
MTTLTNEEQKTCFKLLDEYAKTRHKMFLAEFFSRDTASYFACFRPLGGTANDPDCYACEYLQFEVVELRTMASGQSLPPDIIAKLSAALVPTSGLDG